MIACKLCIMRKGLRGADVAAGTCPYVFKTEEDLEKHLLDEHDIETVKNESKR